MFGIEVVFSYPKNFDFWK